MLKSKSQVSRKIVFEFKICQVFDINISTLENQEINSLETINYGN